MSQTTQIKTTVSNHIIVTQQIAVQCIVLEVQTSLESGSEAQH